MDLDKEYDDMKFRKSHVSKFCIEYWGHIQYIWPYVSWTLVCKQPRVSLKPWLSIFAELGGILNVDRVRFDPFHPYIEHPLNV